MDYNEDRIPSDVRTGDIATQIDKFLTGRV